MTIEERCEALCGYFDWDIGSEQYNCILNDLREVELECLKKNRPLIEAPLLAEIEALKATKSTSKET